LNLILSFKFYLKSVVGCWLLGRDSLVVGCPPVDGGVVGCWLLVVGCCWWLVDEQRTKNKEPPTINNEQITNNNQQITNNKQKILFTD
jgi:hypothetical protein